MATSTQIRREACARLAEIAGYADLDIDGTLARPMSREVLVRKALRATEPGSLLEAEVRELAPIVAGQAWVLDDAVLGGAPATTPEPAMTIEDFATTVKEVLG